MNRIFIFCFIFLLSSIIVLNVHAQKIKFGSVYSNARHSQKELQRLITKDSSIEVAFKKLKPYFLIGKGEKFNLIGKKCKEGVYRTKFLNIFPPMMMMEEQTPALLTRKDETLKEQLGHYSGTLLLFQRFEIPVPSINDIYEVSTVTYQYFDSQKIQARRLSYDPLKAVLAEEANLYTADIDMDEISEPQFTISYRHSKRIDSVKNVKLIYATPDQKKAIRGVLSEFNEPGTALDINAPAIAELVTEMKKEGIQVDRDNLVNWYNNKP